MLKFTIVSNNVDTKINDEYNGEDGKTFIQHFNCGGHTRIKYGALSAPLKEVLELGFAWFYGCSNLPNSQNDEFYRLCEELLSLNREIERNNYLERKTLNDRQVNQLP